MSRDYRIDGTLVDGIPAASRGFARLGCEWCRRRFWTEEGYRGHYALVHMLRLSPSSYVTALPPQ